MKTASRSEMEALAKKLVAPVVQELKEGEEELRDTVRFLSRELRAAREELSERPTKEDVADLSSEVQKLRADATRLIQSEAKIALQMHEALDDKIMQQRLAVSSLEAKLSVASKSAKQAEQATLHRVKLLEDLTPTIRAKQLAHDEVHVRMLARFEQLENLSIKNHSAAINKVAEALVEAVAQVATRGE